MLLVVIMEEMEVLVLQIVFQDHLLLMQEVELAVKEEQEQEQLEE